MSSMNSVGCGRDLYAVSSITKTLDLALQKNETIQAKPACKKITSVPASCPFSLVHGTWRRGHYKSGETFHFRYEFISIPLVHPRLKREFFLKCKGRQEPFTRSELILPANDWTTYVIGKVSPYINVDSKFEPFRKQSEQVLEQELNFAYHIGISAVIVRVAGLNCTNLARIVYTFVSSVSQNQVWVQVPLISEKSRALYWRSDCKENENVEESTWEWWNRFHSQCSFDKKIAVVLELTSDLPPEGELKRWYGEPVKCLIIPTNIFLTNKGGYPVLSRMHQAFVKSMMTLDIQILVKGHTRHDDVNDYHKYIAHLWENSRCVQDPVGDFGKGYEDCLQCPLQPLMNNLEAHTYEIFEKDPVKYNEYSKAIYYAILENIKSEEKRDKSLTIMVVGAGRGPLVSATLSAAFRADRTVKIYAIEKNPNAVATLQAHKEEFWHDRVTVVSSDMRTFEPPEKADILISELLGSFGDNELSPECLDGAQKFLKAGGISIPAGYTSYICPIQTPKLYNEMKMLKVKDNNSLSNFERPYVVLQKNRYVIAKHQPLFTFVHPNHDDPKDNSRYKSLSFYAKEDSVLHGFAGYFDTVLYKDIKLSILPDTYSTGMFSWFPIFFPISQPVHVKAGDEIELHFWRIVSKTDVWYEWTIAKPVPLHIHNANGRSYKIGLA